MKPAFDAVFMPAPDGGQRLWLHHVPPATVPMRGALLFIHAFGEEMNKSRRMVALTARKLAESGFAVLLVDLKGCGDSSGDLEATRWQDWLDDVVRAAHWLGKQHSEADLWLWGHRAGCLLAVQALPLFERIRGLLLWQPPTSGKVLLQQFLRLRLASALQDGNGKAAAEELKVMRAKGDTLDIAGYRLNADIAAGFESAAMTPPAIATPGCVVVLDLLPQPGAAASPAVERLVAGWSAAGFDVEARCVAGPVFWQTTEIETAPALLDATCESLRARMTV